MVPGFRSGLANGGSVQMHGQLEGSFPAIQMRQICEYVVIFETPVLYTF